MRNNFIVIFTRKCHFFTYESSKEDFVGPYSSPNSSLIPVVLEQFCFVCLCVFVRTYMNYTLFVLDWRLTTVKIHWSRNTLRPTLWLKTFGLWPTGLLCVCSMQTLTVCISFPIRHQTRLSELKLEKWIKNEPTTNQIIKHPVTFFSR